MDFAGTDPILRTITFAGILFGAAICAWWTMTRPHTSAALQIGSGLPALGTIPAAIVAPFEDGTMLTWLGLAAIAAFVLCGALTALAIRRQPGSAPGTPEPGAAGRAEAPATRVAGSIAATVARPGPAAEQTVALGPAADIAAIAFLVEYSASGHPYRLGADTHLGRDPGAEITIEDDAASREHARIKHEDGRFVLYDLGSTNGTRLVRNGRRRKIAAPAPLQDLDMVEIGETRLVFLSVELPPR